jgi:hypothetical protein
LSCQLQLLSALLKVIALLLLSCSLLAAALPCREELELLPPEADLDAYSTMPVDQFGMALLR